MRILLSILWVLNLFTTLSPNGLVHLESSPGQPPVNYSLQIHPAPPFVVGDQVSFELFAPAGQDLSNATFHVIQTSPDSKDLGTAKFSDNGYGYQHAILQWAWNTNEIQPGVYRFEFELLPAQIRWQQTIEISQPANTFPTWEMTQTNCCIIHYLSGSDAERDMPWLAAQIEEKSQQIAEKLGGTLSQKLDLDLLPRVLGQGGFTGSEVYISYSDQNYILGDVQMIISHELVHRLDRETGGKLDSTLLAEGLAVYLSGGHYKPEIIPLRAAALAQMGWYIPLDKLANEFYTSQHEIGYIEAAGFVGYLVQTYGWDAFLDFYRNLSDPAGLTPAQQLSQGLQLKYQRSLSEMEQTYWNQLAALPVPADIRTDVRITIELFDTIRAFQRKYDPAAFFQQAWIIDLAQMREKGIVSDYSRNPVDPNYQYYSSALYLAGQEWRAGQHSVVEQKIQTLRLELAGSG